MKKEFIIDSSAVIAALYDEESKFDFEKYLPHSVINVVNYSEVIAVLLRDGMEARTAGELTQNIIPKIIQLSRDEALLAAEIRVKGKEYGISTGDSFCLACAKLNNYSVITADRIWSRLNLGIEIIQVR